MTDAPPIYNYDSGVGNALRRAADATTPEQQRELLHLFASYLETEFDRAAGRAQTAIGNVEIQVREQISEIHTMVRELGAFLQEQRTEQRQYVEAVLAGQEGLRVEVGQQIAALGKRLDLQQAAIDSLQATVDEHDRLIGRLAERIARLEQRKHTSGEP